MARFLTLFSVFHISAAMVLASVAFLAVPESAFAAPNQTAECASTCESSYGNDNSSYWTCVAGCCNTYDPGDPNCCSTFCDPSDPDCVAQCGALLTCVPSTCNNMSCLLPPADGVCGDNTCSGGTACTSCTCKGNTSCVCGS